jgi:hypothetical protein
MLAQVPVILEALTGTKISDLMARVPGLAAAGEVNSTLNGADGNSPGEKTNGTPAQPEVPVRGSSGNTNDNTSTNPPENTSPATSETDAQKGTAPTADITSNAAPSNRIPNQRHQMCR